VVQLVAHAGGGCRAENQAPDTRVIHPKGPRSSNPAGGAFRIAEAVTIGERTRVATAPPDPMNAGGTPCRTSHRTACRAEWPCRPPIPRPTSANGGAGTLGCG